MYTKNNTNPYAYKVFQVFNNALNSNFKIFRTFETQFPLRNFPIKF